MKLGILVNGRAGGMRRNPARLARLEAQLPPERVCVTRDVGEIAAALQALRDAGVDTLAVVGGDGSVGGTLTEVIRCWPADALPAVSLTRGGTINTIARSLGARGAPEEQVRELLARHDWRVDTRRPLVEVRSAEGERRAGMVFANGVAVRWLRLYYEDSRQGVAGAAAVVARIVASAGVRGSLARSLFQPSGIRVELDGQALPFERFTVTAAASVEHIGLGFRPFLLAGRDPETFEFAITEARAARLCLELPSLRLGHRRRGSCIHHWPARHVRLRFDEAEPWSVDADVFAATRELELCASPPLRFVVP